MGVLYPATFVSGYSANPPPPVEPQIIYIEAEQGTPRLGHTEFDPLLMAQPGRLSPAWPRRLSGPFLFAQSNRKTPIVENTVGVSRLAIWYRRAVRAAESMEPARPMLSDSREGR